MEFPIRVGEDGARMTPTGVDPYSLPWVQGAAETVPLKTRRKYASQTNDLREKLSTLKAKRPAKTMDEIVPAWGPRIHPRAYKVMDQNPPPADGQTIWS